MPYAQTNSVASLHALRRTHQHATCWKLTRTDGTVYRFTDRDKALTLADGFSYVPGGGINASARQAEVGLKERNVTVRGFIAADAFTTDDFRAGRWDNAQADEYIVDARYPQAGYLRHDRYWFTLVPNFGGELWEAELTGITSRLTQSVGDTFTRNCRFDLGDTFGQTAVPGCKYDLNGNTRYNLDVLSVSTSNPRRVFTLNDGLGSPATGTMDYGKAFCTSGSNSGLSFEIRTQVLTGDDHIITLEVETPFDVAEDDIFHISPGCDGTVTTCKALGQYPDNFGGFPFMPGPDKVLQAPG